MKRKLLLSLSLVAILVGSMGAGLVSAAEKPVKIGLTGIFSGRLAMLTQSQLNAMKITAEEINERGGLLGRPIEIIHRDSKGKPEEAVKIARDFIERDKVDFLFDGGTTREAFAVKEVSRDLKFLTLITAAETTAITADPAQFGEWSFRVAVQGLHGNVGFARAVANVAKEKNLKRFYAVIPDYAFGRDQESVFFHFLKQYYPEVEKVGTVYPKLFQPDFSPEITTVLAAKPDAVFNVVWGGDFVAFYKQAEVYGLFSQAQLFTIELTHIVNTAELRPVPEGLPSMVRHARNVPDTPENHAYWDKYVERYGIGPVHWGYQASTALLFLEAAAQKAGTLEHAAIAKALRGLTIKAPSAQPPAGTVTMRAKDQTAIYYVQAFGYTTAKAPYFKDITYIDWDDILEAEKSYLESQGWTK
jgi:branched-chain amino acid transport system substrate-binding protein